MKIGVHVPQWGPGATRAGVIDVAQAAEECGFDSIWMADHIVRHPLLHRRHTVPTRRRLPGSTDRLRRHRRRHLPRRAGHERARAAAAASARSRQDRHHDRSALRRAAAARDRRGVAAGGVRGSRPEVRRTRQAHGRADRDPPPGVDSGDLSYEGEFYSFPELSALPPGARGRPASSAHRRRRRRRLPTRPSPRGRLAGARRRPGQARRDARAPRRASAAARSSAPRPACPAAPNAPSTACAPSHRSASTRWSSTRWSRRRT